MPVPVVIATAGSRIIGVMKGAAQGYRSTAPLRNERSIEAKVGMGIGAMLVLGVCIGKDLMDFVFGLLMGSGLTFVLLPVAILAWGVQFIFTTFAWFCVHLYFFMVGFGHSIERKLTVLLYRFLLTGAMIIIGMIPGLSFIPETTLGFLLMLYASHRVSAAATLVENKLGFEGAGIVRGAIGKYVA